MKTTRANSILRSSLIACVLTIGSLASTQSASAQASSRFLARVDIPFAFQMANHSFPAGMYQINRVSSDIILLRGPDTVSGYQMMNSAIKSNPADHGAVVFYRYGGKYFLRRIWTVGATDGFECPMSRAESNAVKGQNKQAATPVELSFNDAPLK